MKQNQDTVFRSVLDFIFPPLCIGCGEYTEEIEMICQKCLGSIDVLDQLYCLTCNSQLTDMPKCDICTEDSLILFSFGEYHSALKEMIIQFKFKGLTKPAEVFSGRIVDSFRDSIASLSADYLVPIPLTASRQNKRGYNQAEVFGQYLSQLLQIPTNTDILYRVKNSKPQARLPIQKRAENIKEVFALDDEDTEKYTLIIVDDVVTSGSTVREAVTILQDAGHHVPGVITLAHAFNL